jgi:hypothetical protein
MFFVYHAVQQKGKRKKQALTEGFGQNEQKVRWKIANTINTTTF